MVKHHSCLAMNSFQLKCSNIIKSFLSFHPSTSYLLLFVLAISVFAQTKSVDALFEDQVGRFDWRHQFIGRVEHVLRTSDVWQDHQTLVVSTKSNVLSGLHLRNGSIHWRHILEDGSQSTPLNYLTSAFPTKQQQDSPFDCPVLSVNGFGRWIRCWHSSGVQISEHNLPNEFLVEIEKQPSDYHFLYEAFLDEQRQNEPSLLIAKISYSNYLVELYKYGFRSTEFKSIGKVAAGRWLTRSTTSCQLITSKSLICANVDGLELQVLSIDHQQAGNVATNSLSFKRLPLSSFGLKTDNRPKFLKVERLPYQTDLSIDRTVTISKPSKSGKYLFAINLAGDGYLLLQISLDSSTGGTGQSVASPQINLVKVFPNAVQMTLIPLISSVDQSSSVMVDKDEFGLAVLFSKDEALQLKEDQENEAAAGGEKVYALKLVIFHLKTWSEIAAMSSEQILLQFSSKRSVSPIDSSGKLVKRLDNRWNVDVFEILPIRTSTVNPRNGRNQYRYVYKMLIGTVDGTLILSNLMGKVTWSREEALAEIVGTVMLDLPLSETDASLEQEYGFDENNQNIISQFANRIKSQLTQLTSWVRSLQQWVSHHGARVRRNYQKQVDDELEPRAQDGAVDDGSDDEGNGSNEDEDDDDEDEVLVRDYFGLHKVIVLRTKVGKLFVIDSMTGRVIWSKYEPLLELKSNEAKFPIWVQRTSAHYPHSAVCTFLTESAADPQHESIIYSFEPFSGETLDLKRLPFSTLQAMLVYTIHDSEYRRPILFLDSSFNAHLYPATLAEQFAKVSSNYYMMLANRTTGQIVGYSFDKSSELTGPIARPVWSFKLPQEGTTKFSNLNVVFKRPYEHVHSQGRVLGDRNVLYKYLNPNLAAIIWEAVDGQDKPLITLYLVDSITGNIVYSIVHRRARGPIQIVHSENSVIYSFYNEKLRRNEIASIELYEGSEQVNSTAFSSMGRDLLALPIAEQQSFIFPTGIGIMTDTETQKGITTKHILISLPTGGLLELPRAFLDPRRPIKPTQEHAEEGLIPYVPELPIPSEALINYNQTIFAVKGIQTAPTTLESTSLVFAYGLDIFYTRVTPSKTFDILKDDFDHLLILAVLLALIGFSYLAKFLAQRKSLNAAWK